MGALRTFARNAASNTAGQMVHLVVALLLTPFVLGELGKEMFGIWTIIVAISGYYGILDFGIKSAVGQYVTRYLTAKDYVGVSRTLSSAVAITLPLGLLLMLGSVGVAWLGPDVLNISAERQSEFRTAVLILGATIGLSFPLAVFGSATYARQRFEIENGIAIFDRLLSAGCIYWTLTQGYGLVGVAVSVAASQLLAFVIRLRVAHWLLPELKVRPSLVSKASVRELWNFGIFNFLSNAADRLILYTDVLVLSVGIGAVSVTVYEFGAKFIHTHVMFVQAVAWTLTPQAAALDTEGRTEGLASMWIHGTRFIATLGAVLTAGMVFLGHDFLRIWLANAEEMSASDIATAATVMAVLAVAVLFRAASTTGKQVLFGMREVKFLGLLSIGEAVCNLVLSVASVMIFRDSPTKAIIGVAVATLIPSFIAQMIIQPLYLSSRIQVSAVRVALGALAPVTAAIAVTGLLVWWLRPLLPVVDWATFVRLGALTVGPAVLVAAAVGFTKAERTKFLRRIRPGS